jgi:hypothetical protein
MLWSESRRAAISRRIQELLEELVAAEVERAPVRLNLPNLRCREVHFSGGLSGLPLQIAATVENVGQAPARECTVQAEVWLSVAGTTHQLSARCPALNPRTSFRVKLGSIPNVAENQFANATVTVDPPTAARPGGDVWESNEEDNVRWSGVYLAPVPLEPLPEEPGEPPQPERPTPPFRP